MACIQHQGTQRNGKYITKQLINLDCVRVRGRGGGKEERDLVKIILLIFDSMQKHYLLFIGQGQESNSKNNDYF